MRSTAKIILTILAVAILIFAAMFWHLKGIYSAWTASTSKGEPLFERELLETYGEKIIADLISKDVKLAIVSRAGQPRKDLPPGINYTHSAFWLYAPSENAAAPQYAVYNLYHNEDNRLISRLETDTAADFLRLTREHDVGVIIPSETTQNSLIAYIKSERYTDMHEVNYSLISNPLDARFQNCNEFMLDVMGAALWGTRERSEVKTTLKAMLKPAMIKTSWLRRTLGPRIDERLILEDQSKVIQTTTRETLAQFLDSTGQLSQTYILDLRTD